MIAKKKILLILPRIPWPLEKGDKLRAYHQIRYLSRYNSLIICCLHDKPIHSKAVKQLKDFCEELHFFKLGFTGIIINVFKAFFSGIPLQAGYFYNSKAAREIKKIFIRHQPDAVYCQLIRTAKYASDLSTLKVLDYQDVFSAGMLRRAEAARGWEKLLFKSEYKRLLKYEHKMFEAFDVKTIISEPDRKLIPHPLRNEIQIIPNGIDTDFFSTDKVTEKDIDILFTGNMNYPPNISAAIFLVQEILPKILKQNQSIKLMLAGANPNPKLKALQSENVVITGWVDDIRECYNRSKVFIAPMRIGTGLQNKLLEAMAMGLPSITSKLANDALGGEHNVNIMIGETAEDFAENLIMLLNDKELADRIALNGQEFVKKTFCWEAAGNSLNTLFLD